MILLDLEQQAEQKYEAKKKRKREKYQQDKAAKIAADPGKITILLIQSLLL